LTLALVFRLEPFWVQVGTMIAALPPAATSLTVAQREGSDVEGIAAAIVVATALACITWPLLAWWLLGAAPRAV
jgi:predicted permease